MTAPHQRAKEACKARYRWNIRSADPDRAAELTRLMNISPVTARVILARGIMPDPEAARKVLSPTLNDLHHPRLLKDMDKAAKRLAAAVRAKEKIVIYADYDCDGICAAALLSAFLDIAKADSEVFIPEREKEGYGLAVEAVPALMEKNPRLIVTVDNGVMAHRAVDALSSKGVEVIVTDHHLPGDSLPKAYAVVNPMRDDCTYPFEYLCGAAVAYKLAWALAIELSDGMEKVLPPFREALINVLPLVALATVADIMPLTGENRPLVQYGMRLMRTAPTPGIKALLEKASLKTDKLAADALGYGLGPRINAAGRLGRARVAYDLLRAKDKATAEPLAAELDELNTKRRAIESGIFKKAEAMVPQPVPPAIVMQSGDWHPGVIGVVAGRMADRFDRPTVLVNFGDNGIGKGSGRSVPGLNMKKLLDECSSYLVKYGGHEQAAGLTVRKENWDLFARAFADTAQRMRPDGPPEPSLETDGEIQLDSCTLELCNELNSMEPYGLGFPKPLFIARNVRIMGDVRPMGKTQAHWSFRASQDGSPAFRAVGFGMGDRRAELEQRRREGAVDFVFEPGINTFNGKTSVELYIRDIGESGAAK